MASRHKGRVALGAPWIWSSRGFDSLRLVGWSGRLWGKKVFGVWSFMFLSVFTVVWGARSMCNFLSLLAWFSEKDFLNLFQISFLFVRICRGSLVIFVCPFTDGFVVWMSSSQVSVASSWGSRSLELWEWRFKRWVAPRVCHRYFLLLLSN